MPNIYNAPNAAPSTVGTQFETHYWDRKSLIDVAEDMHFTKLADTRWMPMHYGKELKVYFYVPLLDDRNVNDQGIDASGATIVDGNLYGSSTDVGTISGKMPALNEEGGRVNRIGMIRLERSGTIKEYGFFMDFTEDSMTFDTDAELYAHWSREMVTGATEITEDLVQIDLLNAAGTIVYTGAATSDATMSPEGADPSLVTYMDMKKLSIALDDNLTPKDTQIIKGSRMTDTVTVSASRIMYIGSEMQITVENLVDGLGNAAFRHVRQYADAATIMKNEIGTVADFRIIVVPKMLKFAGEGEAVGTNPGYAETNNNYDIAPMLVVGSKSFATIGLQSGGKKGKGKMKFKIIVKKPGREIATIQDPYGKVGFSSISFWHGFIALRPERIAIIKTCIPD